MFGGDIVGVVYENPLFTDHSIMIEPGVSGTLLSLPQDGMYNVT